MYISFAGRFWINITLSHVYKLYKSKCVIVFYRLLFGFCFNILFKIVTKGRIIFYEDGGEGGSEDFMGGAHLFPNLKKGGGHIFSRV